jgi:hypothetical protein
VPTFWGFVVSHAFIVSKGRKEVRTIGFGVCERARGAWVRMEHGAWWLACYLGSIFSLRRGCRSCLVGRRRSWVAWGMGDATFGGIVRLDMALVGGRGNCPCYTVSDMRSCIDSRSVC